MLTFYHQRMATWLIRLESEYNLNKAKIAELSPNNLKQAPLYMFFELAQYTRLKTVISSNI